MAPRFAVLPRREPFSRVAYAVNELFYTLQGEGARAGRPAVFCRFTGCNLWTGREQDRADAICRFCDTDFVGSNGPDGGRFETARDLATAAAALWPPDAPEPYLVATGGEPALQLDAELVEAFHREGFEVGIETNGTRPLPVALDWICVSPKAGAPLVQRRGDELKVVYPQSELDLAALAGLPFDHFFVQPMDGPSVVSNTTAAVQWCLSNPPWRLSLQTHKLVGLR